MTVFDSLKDYIEARRNRRRAAFERDIDLVLRACLPTDWGAAPDEPAMARGCIHPIDQLVVNMLSQQVACKVCLARLDNEEVRYRLEQR